MQKQLTQEQVAYAQAEVKAAVATVKPAKGFVWRVRVRKASNRALSATFEAFNLPVGGAPGSAGARLWARAQRQVGIERASA